MTDAGWTSEKPTEAGWYWWRSEIGTYEIEYLDSHEGVVGNFDEYGKFRPLISIGEWLGPLSPHDRQQGLVADWLGLIRDIQRIRDSVENGIPPEHRPGFQRACNEILGLVMTHKKLAQAAVEALQREIATRDSTDSILATRIRELESRFTQRTAELEAAKQWKLQLCNLTPGGSEFADDPAYCAEWVRKSRENQHNVILDKYREAKSLKAELERMRGELDRLTNRIEPYGY